MTDLVKSAVVLLLVLELASCGQLPSMRSEPNFRLFIDTIGGEHTSLDADPTKEKLARGAGEGAAVGGSTGAATAVLCGPWFLLCLPFTVGAGTVIGGGVGATAGFTGLSEESAKSLNDVLTEIDDRRDFRQELREGVIALIPESDQANREDADVLVTIKIKRIELVQHSKNNVSLSINASTQVKQTVRNKRLKWRLKEFVEPYYRCSIPKRDAKEWLEREQEDTIDNSLTSCIQTISKRISTDLMKATHSSNYRNFRRE